MSVFCENTEAGTSSQVPPWPAGEYVFDHSWAHSCSRLTSTRYYPKLQSCVPFTPATGARILLAPGPNAAAVRRALATTLKTITGEPGVLGWVVQWRQASSSRGGRLMLTLAPTLMLQRYGYPKLPSQHIPSKLRAMPSPDAASHQSRLALVCMQGGSLWMCRSAVIVMSYDMLIQP